MVASPPRTSELVHRRLIDVVATDAQTDRIQLDVVNERRDAGQTTRDVRHLTLTEGEPHLLDVIEARHMMPNSGCRQATVTLELSASIVEDELLKSAALT